MGREEGGVVFVVVKRGVSWLSFAAILLGATLLLGT